MVGTDSVHPKCAKFSTPKFDIMFDTDTIP